MYLTGTFCFVFVVVFLQGEKGEQGSIGFPGRKVGNIKCVFDRVIVYLSSE